MNIDDYTEAAPGVLVAIPGESETVRAFVPIEVPNTLSLGSKIARLNEEAAILIGKIQTAGDVLDPAVELYLRQEAIASNRIEGTFTTAKNLYIYEATEKKDALSEPGRDNQEVLNYINAMRGGVELLQQRPLNLNMIMDLHCILLKGVRGKDKTPGVIRTDQNAIGSPSRPALKDARFIPPPAGRVKQAMYNLEAFIHEESDLPDLVRAALFHYQFETIHPFRDGNGRLGRLLVPLLLIQWGKLPHALPRFYLSPHLAEHDEEYRDRLLRVSQKGEWDNWIRFFLGVIIAEGKRTLSKALELQKLKADFENRVLGCPGKMRAVIDCLFEYPAIRLSDIMRVSKVTHGTARNYAKKLVEKRILVPNTESYRNLYFASEIFKVFFDE